MQISQSVPIQMWVINWELARMRYYWFLLLREKKETEVHLYKGFIIISYQRQTLLEERKQKSPNKKFFWCIFLNFLANNLEMSVWRRYWHFMPLLFSSGSKIRPHFGYVCLPSPFLLTIMQHAFYRKPPFYVKRGLKFSCFSTNSTRVVFHRKVGTKKVGLLRNKNSASTLWGYSLYL